MMGQAADHAYLAVRSYVQKQIRAYDAMAGAASSGRGSIITLEPVAGAAYKLLELSLGDKHGLFSRLGITGLSQKVLEILLSDTRFSNVHISRIGIVDYAVENVKYAAENAKERHVPPYNLSVYGLWNGSSNGLAVEAAEREIDICLQSLGFEIAKSSSVICGREGIHNGTAGSHRFIDVADRISAATIILDFTDSLADSRRVLEERLRPPH